MNETIRVLCSGVWVEMPKKHVYVEAPALSISQCWECGQDKSHASHYVMEHGK